MSKLLFLLPKLEKKRYLITAALPYANGLKHIGHLAGAYIPADIFARYLRMRGKETLFVCGSDEHGTAIANQALIESTTPKKIIDKYHHIVKENFERLQISFDIYHRTSEQIHHKTSQELFLELNNKGVFETKINEQYFDSKVDKFLADRYIKGTCPNCKSPNAYGDQCENCGTSLSPNELINPVSSLSGSKPILKKTKHWYLPLNKFEEWLTKWILEDHKKDWKQHVYGQCKSWIGAGLKPRAVTRDLDWGIPVPLDEAEGKVLYVWFDAPIGYISATKQWAIEHNKNWEDYWKKDDTGLFHFVGKDNIVFHCIIFPAILHALDGFILPENIPANEFLNLEGDKMSTSRGWSIEMQEYLEQNPDKTEELRYVLTSILPETGDSEFTWVGFKEKVNNELVGILGNLINRTSILMHKYFDGVISCSGNLHFQNATFIENLHQEQKQYHASLVLFRFKEALQSLMNICRIANKYLTDNEPWKIFSEDPQKVRNILQNTLLLVREIGIYCQPFLPLTSEKISYLFGAKNYIANFEKPLVIENGLKINEIGLLFQKLDDEFIEKQIKILTEKTKNNNEGTNMQKEEIKNIKFEDFSKLDLRVGKIISAEKVKKANRLLHFKVNIGVEVRDIVSGIAEFYEPEALVNKKVLVVTNLEPRTIKKIESKGMLLTSEDTNGMVFIVEPNEQSEIGSKVC